MKFDPTLAAMLADPWSNNACRGYVIYAMENCGFPPRTSGALSVSSIMYLISKRWTRPSTITKTAPINIETLCPDVRTGKRAALVRCRLFAFPHRTTGRRLSI